MTGTETPGSPSGISDTSGENQPAQPPADLSPSPSDPAIERLRINVEHYKAKLDFWKYVIVGGFVAAAIAAIPPFFTTVPLWARSIIEETLARVRFDPRL
jgi:hypothetical protein